MSNINHWLKELGLEKYIPLFVEQEIDETVLAELSEQDLEKLGLPLGPRKKILKAINTPSTPAVPVDVTNDTPLVVETADAEKRQLSVMFCDLVGSTEMSQQIDPEDLRGINRAYQDACAGAIKHFGGYVARYMGDGVLAYFGYPQAHEDDAERAVRAGLAVIDAVKAIDIDAITDGGLELTVRVGVATGHVVVGDLIGEGAAQENAVVGETPNLAARLQTIAEPNQVVVSQNTQLLVGGSIRFEPMGQRILKGFNYSIEPWRVLGTGVGGGRFERAITKGLGRFVGRSAEFERLRNDLELASGGRLVISHVIGEPGIGKSRLVYEFFRELGDFANVLEGHCASHGQATAYLPFIDLLRRTFHLNQKPDADSLTYRLAEILNSLGIESKALMPYILNLLGVTVPLIADTDSGLVGLRTREALVAIVLAYSKDKPVVVFINDCHWIDRSSEAVLDTLVQSNSAHGVLTLCTFRPEYQPKWCKTRSASTIELNPFSLAEAKVLFSDRFGTTRIPEETFGELYERSGGNPFFAEELARHMQSKNQKLSFSRDTQQSFSVPNTLEGLLLQRVDQLSAKARRLLQTASVMGRSFNESLVAKVCGLMSADDALGELVQQDLIFRDQGIQINTYRFKHALLQDTVYGSLLSTDQRALHGAIADSLEALYQNRESEIAEELARHYILAKDADKASKWAALAGEKALGLFAHGEAISWFKQVLELLSNEHQANRKLLGPTLVNQMEAYCWEIDYPTMAVLAEEHLPKIQAAGDAHHISRTYTWLGDAYINTGRFVDALNVSKKALKIATEIGDIECTGYALSMHLWLHAVTGSVGDTDYVERESERMLDIAEKVDDLYLKTLAYYSLALDFAQRGYLDRARQWITKSIALGEQSEYSPAQVWALCVHAFVEINDKNFESAELDAHEAIRLAQSKYDHLMAKVTLASVLISRGNTDVGIKMMKEVSRERKQRNISQIGYLYWPEVVYGAGLMSTGQFQVGVEYLEEAHQRFIELGNPRAAALAALTLGEAYLEGKQTNPNEAVRALQEADRLGEETAMNGVVARALIGLAMLSAEPEDTSDYIARAQNLITSLKSPALEQRLSEALNRQV